MTKTNKRSAGSRFEARTIDKTKTWDKPYKARPTIVYGFSCDVFDFIRSSST
ncbi:hypothetical protein EVAR_99508_1, partial [Eumeta japonica]